MKAARHNIAVTVVTIIILIGIVWFTTAESQFNTLPNYDDYKNEPIVKRKYKLDGLMDGSVEYNTDIQKIVWRIANPKKVRLHKIADKSNDGSMQVALSIYGYHFPSDTSIYYCVDSQCWIATHHISVLNNLERTFDLEQIP